MTERTQMAELDLEQIKLDREAGTPGPWRTHDCESYGDRCKVFYQEVWNDDVDILVTSEVTRAHNDGGKANMRRIARVPDLEARVISDAERIATLEDALDYQIRSKAKIAHREMFFILLFCVTVGGFSIAVSVGLV